jgi:hypothetical protein
MASNFRHNKLKSIIQDMIKLGGIFSKKGPANFLLEVEHPFITFYGNNHVSGCPITRSPHHSPSHQTFMNLTFPRSTTKSTVKEHKLQRLLGLHSIYGLLQSVMNPQDIVCTVGDSRN